MATPTKAHWKIADGKSEMPRCSRVPNSHGIQVLVWPRVKPEDGYSESPTAFYGCRQTDAPMFYLYGAVLNPQPKYWAPLPEGPR